MEQWAVRLHTSTKLATWPWSSIPRVLNLVPARWQLNLEMTERSNLSPSMITSSIPTEPWMANTY